MTEKKWVVWGGIVHAVFTALIGAGLWIFHLGSANADVVRKEELAIEVAHQNEKLDRIENKLEKQSSDIAYIRGRLDKQP